MGIGVGDEVVVGIDKLQETPLCHVDTSIAGHAESTVLLPHIDNLRAIVHETVHGTDVRTVIHNDDLALVGLQREFQNAVNALAEHLYRQVVIGDDERYQRLGFLT